MLTEGDHLIHFQRVRGLNPEIFNIIPTTYSQILQTVKMLEIIIYLFPNLFL
jgi:hypothetical protein